MTNRALRPNNGPRRNGGQRLPSPLGNVRNTEDVVPITQALQQRMIDKGGHVVLVDPDGFVYAAPSCEHRSELLIDQYPTWLAGVFTNRVKEEDLMFALLATDGEHREAA